MGMTVRGNPEPEGRLDEIVGRLSALASPVRLRVYRLLIAAEPDGLVAGEIAAHLALASNTLSFHLKALTHAGLLRVEQEGRYQRYRAAVEGLRSVLTYLTQHCCQDQPALCALPDASRWPPSGDGI